MTAKTKREIARANKTLETLKKIKAGYEETRKTLTGVSVDIIDLNHMEAMTDELITAFAIRADQISRRFN